MEITRDNISVKIIQDTSAVVTINKILKVYAPINVIESAVQGDNDYTFISYLTCNLSTHKMYHDVTHVFSKKQFSTILTLLNELQHETF